MSHHIHSYDLLYTCAALPPLHRGLIGAPKLILPPRTMPGKTLVGDSHVFISAIMILVFARGCFGPGAVCFQDIQTSGGGIRLHYVFAVVGFGVSKAVCLCGG